MPDTRGPVRLGLIARADHRGLGQQTRSAFRALDPARTMVVNCPSVNPLPLHLEYFPGATVVNRIPTDQDCHAFLSSGVDVVYSAETFYNPNLPDIARQLGVKTVLHANYEFLDRSDRPSLWAAPSMWHFDEFPEPRQFLPVPIALDQFPDLPRPATATHFCHVIGRPAVHDRNGTIDLLAALPFVRSPITVTIRCQDPGYIPSILHRRSIPANVQLIVRSADIPDYWDLYAGQDVLVMPRRFGGLCLPCNEGLGAGMPVIMPNIDPNNTWLPADWLVPATKTGTFMAKTRIDVYTTDPRALAAKIDQFATDHTFYAEAQTTARDLAKRHSWDALLPEYRRVLASL